MMVQNNKYKLYKGDCLDIMDRLIKDGVNVDLTVTSPPYDDIRNYNNSLVWDFDVFKNVANRLYQITKEGGIVVWIVGDRTVKGSETGTSFKQALYFKEIGFNLHDTMIYAKNSVSVHDPRNKRYKQCFEYMFVLSKGKPTTYNEIKDKPNKHKGKKLVGISARDENGKGRRKRQRVIGDFQARFNIWEYAIGNCITKDKYAFKHPAIFPEKLAEDHILSWSNEGELVFDPFMGSNTTGKMALLNNRMFIGIEKVEEYFEVAKKRVEGVIGE